MGLIKGEALIKPALFWGAVCGFLLLLPAGGVYGQSGSNGSVLAEEEILNLKKKSADTGIGTAERHGALIRLAGLSRLLGDLETAARAWNEAAFVDPERRDDRALLEGARCFAALGELDTAEAQARAVLSGNNAGLLREAQVLAAQITAFRSGDVSALTALAENPDYAEYKVALLYTRWKISGDDRYKSRLLAEHPESPEARIAGSEGGGAAAYGVVSGAPLALWFFFPGREGVTLAPPAPAAATEGPAVLIIPAVPPAPEREIAAPAAALQIGLFSREGNARTMTERLKAAGFQADIIRRALNGTDYWAVTVPAGNDMGRTIIQLKDAGFQSFPIF